MESISIISSDGIFILFQNNKLKKVGEIKKGEHATNQLFVLIQCLYNAISGIDRLQKKPQHKAEAFQFLVD